MSLRILMQKFPFSILSKVFEKKNQQHISQIMRFCNMMQFSSSEPIFFLIGQKNNFFLIVGFKDSFSNRSNKKRAQN